MVPSGQLQEVTLKLLLVIEKYAVKIFLLLLARAFKIYELNEPPQVRCIYCFWHRNILPLMYLHRNKGIVILISPSRDGELIAGPASLFGYHPVRGSSNRNNLKSLRELIRLAQERSIAITPDGPLGPKELVKESLVYLAAKTELPIVGVAVDIDKEWVFRTWDNFRIPKPFSRIKVSYTEPYYIESKDDIKNKRLTIQRLMDTLTAETRNKQIKT